MKNNIAMIAAAGRGSRMLSLTENNPKAMLPFNSKPIIGHHLDYLIKYGFKKVIIVVGYQKQKLIDYVNMFYSDKIDIRFAEQKELNGLAGAIAQGLNVLTKEDEDNSNLLILLGDIVLQEELLSLDYDWIGHDFVDDWSRWCLIEDDDKTGEIIQFIDKPEIKPDTNKNIMGVYNITDIKFFIEAVLDTINDNIKIRNEFQLSQVFEKYINSGHPVIAKWIRYYLDLGELDALNKTRKNITRHFNSITATNDGTIIKSSMNIKKIQQEIDWFSKLDMKLKIYTPHFVDYDYKKGIYELEFIHSNPIQELYLFNLPEDYQWLEIFKNIKKYLDKSRSIAIKKDINKENHEIIIEKTLDRVKLLPEFTKGEFITINDIVYKNPLTQLDKILTKADEMFCKGSKEYFSNLHGDLFFGNMLYDVNTNVLKVIDPRGDYGGYTNHGDIRYDIAKLNHSVNGYYDFIVNGLYFLEEVNDKFYYHFYESKQSNVKEVFDNIILKDYDKQQINLLTGLLFLTMIPLHEENPKNQRMQFIRAVEFLNEFI